MNPFFWRPFWVGTHSACKEAFLTNMAPFHSVWRNYAGGGVAHRNLICYRGHAPGLEIFLKIRGSGCALTGVHITDQDTEAQRS